MSKYVVLTGGVYSAVGKGQATTSLAFLMKQRGHSVNYVKLDPYLNVDCGIIRPDEHGESFVTDDGFEVDLDAGHAERKININITRDNVCSAGRIYKELIDEQEKGTYLGQTLQVTPHFVNKVIKHLEKLGENHDIVFIELGGSIGDSESYPFFETLRALKAKKGEDVLVIMVAPVIWVNTISEFKTKPLQNSVRTLQSYGINPDILLCRFDRESPSKLLDKISQLTGIPRSNVFDAPDTHPDRIPIEFYDRHIDDLIADRFHLKRNGCRIHKYRDLVERYINNDLPHINIGIFGKYANSQEAYLSLKESLYHAGVNNNVKIDIHWIQAEDLEEKRDISGFFNREGFNSLDGIIVPGGFDNRGVEGKIKAIQYAREHHIPFLGICLGLQCAVIEFARHVCKLKDANSLEFDKDCKNPVIHFVEGQEGLTKKAGTMRLGAYDCRLKKDSLVASLYGQKIISERHRHRYEVNNEYVEEYEKRGFLVSGRNPDSELVEMMEISQELHPFFVGTQAHPEFKSRLVKPAPLFDGLVKAAYKNFVNKTAKVDNDQ